MYRARPEATWDGTLERIHHALYVAVREQAGREASPTTAIIDSQSAKGAQNGGPCSTHSVSARSAPCHARAFFSYGLSHAIGLRSTVYAGQARWLDVAKFMGAIHRDSKYSYSTPQN
jgi:hypothetical protein